VRFENAIDPQASSPALLVDSMPLQPEVTVLLVEDEDFVRKVTAEVLRSFGYQVLVACNADEATAIFMKHSSRVALVLTDLVMPGKNGRKLAKRLSEISPGVSIIITSGHPDVMSDDRSAPRLHYLPKPYSAESLMRKINQVLGPGGETGPAQ
jgi:two-component system cell cycle sensor histidine kinase/response regulator CckA